MNFRALISGLLICFFSNQALSQGIIFSNKERDISVRPTSIEDGDLATQALEYKFKGLTEKLTDKDKNEIVLRYNFHLETQFRLKKLLAKIRAIKLGIIIGIGTVFPSYLLEKMLFKRGASGCTTLLVELAPLVVGASAAIYRFISLQPKTPSGKRVTFEVTSFDT